jgi:cell fate regulator YaaT (PSP1 superfamily)
MKAVQIQFAPWDKVYNFDQNDLALNFGDKVIVRTELGLEFGVVAGFKEMDETSSAELKPVLRLATDNDLEKKENLGSREEALDTCRGFIERLSLPMKLVDAHFAFDGSRVTFAFISDGRVDFRDLVKELTRHFNRTIRLHQIGIRDEARLCGDCGHCGRPLCCSGFLKELSSVTSEMAELQQVAHRGSDRISGVCGRLMCCLTYEYSGYEQSARQMPSLDSTVTVDGKKGRVLSWNLLKRTFDVLIRDEKDNSESVIEVSLDKK